MTIRERLEQEEAQRLSPRAVCAKDTRGREKPIVPCPMRTDFEYVLDASFREVSSGIRSMSVSISFGLLLLCIGLYVTCLYLLQ
jgi:hypothetical protein